jgi:hypothetical protein
MRTSKHDNDDYPTDDLQAGQYHGQNEADIRAADDTARGFPIADGNIQGGWRGKKGYYYKKRQQWDDRQPESDAIIQGAFIFDALDFALLFAGFEALRTEVLPVQFAITETA